MKRRTLLKSLAAAVGVAAVPVAASKSIAAPVEVSAIGSLSALRNQIVSTSFYEDEQGDAVFRRSGAIVPDVIGIEDTISERELENLVVRAVESAKRKGRL